MIMADRFSIFDISGRAMAAQMVRLSTNASNMANVGAVASSEAQAYRAMKPVFKTVMDANGLATVQIDRIDQSSAKPLKRHDPGHPLADADGNVWEAAIDNAVELVEMVEISRQYQNNVQALQTAKGLMLETLRIGQ
jgi:flagellar basal-body rod protein FlgC